MPTWTLPGMEPRGLTLNLQPNYSLNPYPLVPLAPLMEP